LIKFKKRINAQIFGGTQKYFGILAEPRLKSTGLLHPKYNNFQLPPNSCLNFVGLFSKVYLLKKLLTFKKIAKTLRYPRAIQN
jgi:hypothetical protein